MTYVIVATYSGAVHNKASTSVASTIEVTPAADTTTLAASAASIPIGTAIQLTVTVAGVSPTGTVEFFAAGT